MGALSWAEICYIQAIFLKEQQEVCATFLTALQISLFIRVEVSQPPKFKVLLRLW